MDVEKIDGLGELSYHFSFFVLLFDHGERFDGFFTFLHPVAMFDPLLEGETVGFRIVLISFFLTPAPKDLLTYVLSGIY